MKNSEELKTILLIDKPKCITSFDVIRILRKKMGPNKIKMGHAGTLDPLATGLLIIGIGKGTKELTKLIKLTKEYEAEILFGIKTDSGDINGQIVEKKEVPSFSKEKIEKILKEMQGDIELPVPLYSAVKKAGKPLYKYARENKEIEAPIKTMHIIKSELMSLDKTTAKIKFAVKSGTYIRSLAEELGQRLGTVATIENLRRTKIGDFSVKNAEKITKDKQQPIC